MPTCDAEDDARESRALTLTPQGITQSRAPPRRARPASSVGKVLHDGKIVADWLMRRLKVYTIPPKVVVLTASKRPCVPRPHEGRPSICDDHRCA